MRKIAAYRIDAGMRTITNSWIEGAWATGLMALHRSSGEARYRDSAMTWSARHNWRPYTQSLTTTFGDDQCCFQTYAELYLHAPSTANNYMLDPALQNIRYMFDQQRTSGRTRWWWCDALFMAPPAVIRLAHASGEQRLLDSMNAYWWDASEFLYDKTDHLFFRDGGFLWPEHKTTNGKKIFWSRGNGWVVAGLARVIPFLPQDYRDRDRYITQFRQMAAALEKIQGSDGMWRTSLADSAEFPDPETSGTAFFTFGLAWGIDAGFLDKSVYWPVVRRGWAALVRNVRPSGALLRVQDVGYKPGATPYEFTREYAEGAVMLAGEQMIRLWTGRLLAFAGSDTMVVDADGDGSEVVTLDAGLSRTPAGAMTRWSWRRNGTEVGTESSCAVTLPVGIHRVELMVYNDQGDSCRDYLMVRVRDQRFVAVSASGHDGNRPENTQDGLLETRWSAQGDGAWIMYDLNSVRAISSVEIAFYQGATRQTVFDIRFSENGTDWVTVFSGRSSGTTTQPERFTTDNAPARFVRIVGHGNTVNDWNSLTEVVINAGATGVVVQRSGVGESMAAGLGAVRYVACGAVHIMVSAGHASEMTLEVYSVDGRLVKRLWQGSSAPSRIAWDLTDSSNSPVANGVYVVSLRSPSAAATTTRSVRIVR